jgi:hypothetical protein
MKPNKKIQNDPYQFNYGDKMEWLMTGASYLEFQIWGIRQDKKSSI